MKKKLCITFIIITSILFTIIFFVLPKLDFMYVPAYKHRLKDKIKDKEKVTDIKYSDRVAQAKNGVYFIYKNKLMFMDDTTNSVKEVCSMKSEMIGVMVRGEDVFFNAGELVVYKMDKSGEIKACVDNNGYVYLDGDYIYVLISGELGKYSLDGKEIWVNDAKYDHFSYNQVFDEYVLYMEHSIGISVPNYYLFDINKVRYKDYELMTEYPQKFPSTEEVYDGMYTAYLNEWVENIDKKVREGGIYKSSESKSLDNYKLKNIIFDFSEFSRASNGYIYFIGRQEVNYRDKDFDKKFKPNVSKEIEDEEKKKLEYKAYSSPIFRAKLEDIENSKENFYFIYEAVSNNMRYKGYADSLAVVDDTVSLLTIYSNGAGNLSDIYVYNIDIETGDYKEVFRKKAYFLMYIHPNIYLTDKYIFIYEYDEKDEGRCITRIDRDGSNPIVVMNENGEVVMKPLEEE